MAAIIPHDHGVCLSAVLEQMPNEAAFGIAADVFSKLGDVTRLRILWLLCHSEECVTNIAAAVGMSDPAVSHHLRILKETGLAARRRIGKEVHYRLADNEEARYCHRILDEVFRLRCP